MTGRLQLIEQRLIDIDPAGFQNLCDAYLVLRENEYSSFNRTGSQLGKQKTIKGTPDSFIRLTDNKLEFIEYTTQADSKITKIKEDLDKCLDSSKTGVEKDKVHKIIICFNSRLTVKEETIIQSYAEFNNIKLELIGIDTLALEIMSKYLWLSRDFLGIPIDTGQILPFDKFISEYNNKASQLSTPLDNTFLHRKKELEEISNHLLTEDLLILSGAPGVGKTKMGIEATNKFIEENHSYQAFAISKKDSDIFEDLKIQLKTDKDYILLIDDANRQLSNLSQIFGVYKEIRNGEIKIIITVRNYALSNIKKASLDFQSQIININKFSDEEIVDIIKSDSFKTLKNWDQTKIVEIADGNARLAIMAARLVQQKQTKFLWGDASDLFDSYFQTFLKDFDLFENENLLKTFAIISFFFTIDRENKAFIENVLKLFELDYHLFNEAIEVLHNRELIEVQYNHARVSEQVMATYFFYKVFIKDSLLLFKTLLFNYFPEWKSRFKDSVISANNSFGYENVFSKINNTLDEYFSAIKNDNVKILDFLDLFWFYKQNDTISYFYDLTKTLPEPENPEYLTNYENNDFVFEKEQTLNFLTRFFDHLTDLFIPAIELCFEYIRKKPQHLPELIRRIREHLIFDEKDERIGYQRQVDFISIIVKNFKESKDHYIAAFFPIAKTFLQHYYRIIHGGRKNNVISYEYPIPLYEVTQNLRTILWQTIFYSFEKYPIEVFDVVKTSIHHHHQLIPKILDFDLMLLIPFIQKKFTPSNFKHTHFIHEMNYYLNRETELKNRSYRELKTLFNTEEYSTFCKLHWNKLRDKNIFDFDDYDEYEKLKTEEIINNFTFSSETEFEKLHKTVANILKIKEDNHFSVGKSIDLVIKTNFATNKYLGFKLLVSVLDNYSSGLYFLHDTISTIAGTSKEWCKKLWNIIEKWNNENSLMWKINFFNYVKDEYINEFYCQSLIDTIQSIDKYAYIYIESYIRFSIIQKDIIIKIIKIVVNKIDQHKVTIVFSDDIFENDIGLFSNDYQLLKDAYFQQYRINHTQIFDINGKGFEQIFRQHPNFLIDFFNEFYTEINISGSDINIKFGFIWEYEGYEDVISETSDFLIENNYYLGFGKHSHSILFKDVKISQKEKAFNFILKELKKYSLDVRRVTIYLDTIRNCMNEKFEEALLFYLSVNYGVENFEKIDWVGNVGMISGDANFGDIYAKRWENILRIVEKSEKTLEMIPIKSFLKKEITQQYEWAESERKRKFIKPDW